jgi:predicted RNase H-like HicB family nuclease
LNRSTEVKIKVVVHDAEEGPKSPPFQDATQGETMNDLLRNLHEAIEGCLSEERTCRNP